MREDWTPCVYMLASRRNGTLYLGVTTNLARRVWEHKTGTGSSFARKYGVAMLVWYETFDEVSAAIAREKAMKKWRRAWKIKRIEAMNPHWRDLYETLI
ncbi:MAG: GIY-YIG nuclease family protein [Oceanicaulis sp.]